MDLVVQVAVAQRQPLSQPEKKPFDQKGTVKGIRPPLLYVDVNGTPWFVLVEAAPDKISYSATEEPGWLSRGMLVRYSGADEKGGTKEPLKELTVFNVDTSYDVGIFDEDDGTFMVAGKLRSVKKGKENTALTVLSGGNKARFDLANKVKINVDFTNLQLLRSGDEVQIKGWFYESGKASADAVIATAPETLKASRKKGRRKRRRSG